MSKRRAVKEKRKSVEIEERIEACEKNIDMIINKTDLSAYNFLVRQIGQLGAQQQELLRSINLQQEYIKEKEMMDDFQEWLNKRLKEIEEQRKVKQQPPQKPERPKSQAEKQLEEEKGIIETAKPQEKKVCGTCHGRGYIGDNEECPDCHPNKR